MRVLIVKVSSLGDIIHTLPAVTDAYLNNSDLSFDWVVEEGFSEIPSWHRAVNKVIPVAIRRWRKNIFKTWRSGEFKRFKKTLKESDYDLVIDAQGLIKSAVIAHMANGRVLGLDKGSIKESFATHFYNEVFSVPRQQHAVERVRQLFSQIFNYSLDNKPCDYGLDIEKIISASNQQQENTLIFLHGTTWETKKWPDQYWLKLAKIADSNAFKVKVLWGNDEEFNRAHHIAKLSENVEVLNKLSLSEIASLLVSANAVVAVDTGLAHLAAALNVPLVSIFGSTDAVLTGTYGVNQIHMASSLSCSPCLNKTCVYQGEKIIDTIEGEPFEVNPACYFESSPDKVWEKVESLVSETKIT